MKFKDRGCDICGATSNLTRHHIVPKQYEKVFIRNRFKNYTKSNKWHEYIQSLDNRIAVICRDCHILIEELYSYYNPLATFNCKKFCVGLTFKKRRVSLKVLMCINLNFTNYLASNNLNSIEVSLGYYHCIYKIGKEYIRECKRS